MRSKPIFKNGNSVIWLILAVVVVLLVIGGFYWLMNKQDSSKQAKDTAYTTPVTPVSSGNVSFDDLKKEVDLEDVSKDPSQVEQDFTALDKDMQGL